MSLREFAAWIIGNRAAGVDACFLGDCGPFSDKFGLGEPSMPSLANLFAFAFVALVLRKRLFGNGSSKSRNYD